MHFPSTGKQEFNMSHCTCAKTAANYFTNKLLQSTSCVLVLNLKGSILTLHE